MQVGDRVRVRNDTSIYPEFSGSSYGPPSGYAGQEGYIVKEIVNHGPENYKFRVAFRTDGMAIGFQEYELELIEGE